ncbi:hypothetical protein L204_100321 [Cryptococcus depauperatus]|nr:nuclear pore complex protein Nup98-Nup96 [Cryptococcus depauperatus CBS 7855]
MFGNSSTWGQTNQNQQQQGGGLFGSGGGFGQQNSGGFGQSAANSGSVFGGGGTSTSGTFGSSNQQSNTAFGARPTFGVSGSTFGQSNTTSGTGGLFGNNNTSSGGFGSNSNTSGGLFGAKPASGGFGSGATSSLFGAKPATGFGVSSGDQGNLKGPNELQTYQPNVAPPPPPTTGTANPAYYPTWQADPSTTSLGKEGPPHLFHTISAMSPYQGASWEELRAMDYQQNRKEATTQNQNAFGTASGGFGQPATSGFGQQPVTNGFGAKPVTTNAFGPSAPSTGFGSTNTGGTSFGTTTNTGGGVFGQSQPQQPSGGGLFGQTNTNTGGGLFGSQAQQNNTGSSLFGNTNSNSFGGAQNSQQQGTAGFGAFGQNKPAFGSTGTTTGFGANSGSTNIFSQTGTGSAGFGGFGQSQNQQQQQQQQQQQPATGGGLFGSGGNFASNNNQQQNSGGSIFGQTNQQQQPAATNSFGAPKTGGLFSSVSTPASTGTTGFGAFGQNNQQSGATGGIFGTGANNTGTSAGLFGQTQPQQNTQQQAVGGGLFGSTPAASSAASGGLFGTKPATAAPSTGLFGQTQPSQQPAQTNYNLFGSTSNNTLGSNTSQGQQSTGLFGAKPAGGGLFGSIGATGTGTGLFGQQSQQQQNQQPQSSNGVGLFGTLGQSQQGSTGLFSSTATQPTQPGAFGGNSFSGGINQPITQQPQQLQPILQASINQNPYGNNPLFAYNGQKLDTSLFSKKPAVPPLTASSYRLSPSTNKSKMNRLRGFASSLSASQSPVRSGSPLSVGSPNRSSLLNSPVAPDRYKGLSESALSPNAFVPRPNIKKLNVTPKLGSSIGGGGDGMESLLGRSALKNSTDTVDSTSRSFPDTSVRTNSFDNNISRHDTLHSPVNRESIVAISEQPLKKGDYWCRPKLEKLKAMSKQELTELRGFTAGRRGYGEVSFLEPVDLTRAPIDDLLGAIIVVDQSELSVYPDDYSDKPPMGKGLNVPARIMLENVFTTDKATKEWVIDPKDPRFQKFVKRVKAIPNTEFISYTDDGVWTFRVEHFTTYGIAESDEEESFDETDMVVQEEGVENDHWRLSFATDDNEEYAVLASTKPIYNYNAEHDSGLEEDEFTESSLIEDDVKIGNDESIARIDVPLSPEWSTSIGNRLGPDGMKNIMEMRNSFFGSTATIKKPSKELAANRRKGTERYESFFERAEEELEKFDERAIKRTSFGETQTSLPKLRKPRKYVKVTLDNSVSHRNEGLLADAGMALGRSFRCSWGPNGELIHFGKICSPREVIETTSSAAIYIEKVQMLASNPKVEDLKACRLLRLHLDSTYIEQIDGVPVATLKPEIRFCDFVARFDAGDRSHEVNVFRLGSALFDELDLHLPRNSSEELSQKIMSIRRKLAVSRWLEDAVAPAVDSDLIANAENKPGKIFALLSGHQIKRAVESALEGGDMRLATLISQAGGQELLKNELLKQLEEWETHEVNAFIALGYRRIYALLAGITDISPGDPFHGSSGCPDVLIAEGLDWKRAFGLHMWYGLSFNCTIRDVVNFYNLSLSSSHPPSEPLPPYLESPGDVSRLWHSSTESIDIVYQLLCLYSDDTISLDQVLRSQDTSPSPFDVRLAWHLYMLLSRALKRRDFEDRDEETGNSASADRLTQGYAAQLIQIGEWKWAAFVLLHLENANGREKALRALLYHHPDLTSEDQAFLTDKLQIPSEWIYASQASLLCFSDDAWEEYHVLIKAKLYDRAYSVLVDKLAPEAIIRNDRHLLERMCSKVKEKTTNRVTFPSMPVT